jgi:hypothetical protein
MKTNTMTEITGYEAPNFDVVETVVEAGFSLSAGIDDAYENDYGEF